MSRLLKSLAWLRSFRLWASLLGLGVVLLATMVLLGHLSAPAFQTLDRLNQDQQLRWLPARYEPRMLSGSTPTRRTSESSRKPENRPIALLPPPTQATAKSGRRPVRSRNCSRASRPMTL